ncbi:MAG: MFS transporter [Chloroflexota bacterium]|jgi:fucose permease
MQTFSTLVRSRRFSLILLTYVAFIALGMPDGLLGVAWPSLRASFALPLDAVGALLVMGTAGYLTSSFLSGKLIARLGVGRVLVASTALTGFALIGYTWAPVWGLVLLMGAAAGLGAGAIDAGLNTYVAAHFSAGWMQWLHASYGIGITTGPILMTVAINALGAWQPGYLAVGGFQLAMTACFILTLPLWAQNGAPAKTAQPRALTDYKTPLAETLRQPGVWLSMSLFFFYVGAEVSLGTWSYTLLTESRAVSTQAAGLWAGSYWATFTLGRILAGLYTKRIGNNLLVIASLAGALAGSALLWWNPAAWANLLAVALIGFAIAPIFPALISATSQRVGVRYSANTIGMQIAAGGLGSAAIPGLVGVLARQVSLEIIPVCFVALYAALLGLCGLALRDKSA